MESTGAVSVHTLDEVRGSSEIRRLVSTLREPGVHLLVVDDAAEVPADVLSLAEVVRAGAVVTCASGRIAGSALALFAAGSLRIASPDAEFAWGETAVVPGLGAILASADPALPARLAWGEILCADELVGGLVHRVAPDPAALVEENLARSGGAAALRLRLRSLTAAREAASWSVGARFDRHLARTEAGA